MTQSPVAAGEFRVLVVCAGNLCRSPAAELILRRGLERYAVAVSSAGVIAPEGSPIHPWTGAALTELALDASAHRATRLVKRQLDGAHLVLAMTRELRADSARVQPSAVSRLWTLREFVRHATPAYRELVTAARLPPPGPDRFLALRDTATALRGTFARVDAEDDIADPISGNATAHQQAVRAIADSCEQLIALVTR